MSSQKIVKAEVRESFALLTTDRGDMYSFWIGAHNRPTIERWGQGEMLSEEKVRKKRKALYVAIALFIFLMWLGYEALVYHNRELLALYVLSGSFSISTLAFLWMIWEPEQ